MPAPTGPSNPFPTSQGKESLWSMNRIMSRCCLKLLIGFPLPVETSIPLSMTVPRSKSCLPSPISSYSPEPHWPSIRPSTHQVFPSSGPLYRSFLFWKALCLHSHPSSFITLPHIHLSYLNINKMASGKPSWSI